MQSTRFTFIFITRLLDGAAANNSVGVHRELYDGERYGQFCPIAKAMEILGEKWTLLTRRLATLEEGLVVKRKIHGQRGYEYLPTESCKELMPVIEQIGSWGMRWARDALTGEDFDLELLMLYMQRSSDPGKLPGRETVIRFHFTDVEDKEYQNWWIVVEGDNSYRRAQAEERLQLLGEPA
jgi:DNA-binding HxlR family transcriptional regulator